MNPELLAALQSPAWISFDVTRVKAIPSREVDDRSSIIGTFCGEDGIVWAMILI